MSMLKQLGLAVLLLTACTARAGLILDTPVLGGSLLVAEDGHVRAEYLGSNAGYFNILFLDTSSDWGSDSIFHKYSPVNGSQFDLGVFAAGTELIFRLYVSNTGLSFYSGAASRNPDGLAHVLALTTLDGDDYLTTVGFEDIMGGGDRDYNDFNFRLTNVIDPPGIGEVPEPSALLLLTIGLLGVFVSRRRHVNT